jgi:hypothetical protein
MEFFMKTAAEVMKEKIVRSKLSTGSRDLDSLIDGIERGQFYLFYSHNQSILNTIIHRILVNSLLPDEKGGFNSHAVYLNICNYHSQKTILNPSLLSSIAKRVRLEPKIVFKNIYAVSAFNEMQQVTAIKEAINFINHNKDVHLFAVHNLTRFVKTSRKPQEALKLLKKAITDLKQITFKNDIALVASCEAAGRDRGRIPKPEGRKILQNESNIIVYLKSIERKSLTSMKAYLMKHPYKKTYQSIILYAAEEGTNLTGRITSSFHHLYQIQIEELKRHFHGTPINLRCQKVFNELIEDVWSPKIHYLSNVKAPCLLDLLNLMASIYNKKKLNTIRKRLIEMEKIFDFSGMNGFGK